MIAWINKIGLIGLIGLVALNIAACRSAEEIGGPPPNATPVTLTLVTDNDESDLETAILQQFEEIHPHITIQTQPFRTRPSRYLQNDIPPDVMMMWSGSWLDIPIRDELVTNISDIWLQKGLKDRIAANLHPLVEDEGKQYMLPIGYSWHAIYYNRELFEQYSLEPPTTWDDLLLIAETLEGNGIIPFSLSGETWTASLWFDYLNLRLNGAEFHRNLIQGQVPYDDIRLQAVFDTWQAMFDAGYFGEKQAALGSQESVEVILHAERAASVIEREVAMTLTDSSIIDTLSQDLRQKLGFFQFPAMTYDTPVAEIVWLIGYIIPANAPRRLEAQTLLVHMTSAETQKLLIQFAGTGTPLGTAPVGVDPTLLNPEMQQGIRMVQGANDVTPLYLAASPREMEEVAYSELGKFIRDAPLGKTNIEQIVRTLEAGRQRALKKNVFQPQD